MKGSRRRTVDMSYSWPQSRLVVCFLGGAVNNPLATTTPQLVGWVTGSPPMVTCPALTPFRSWAASLSSCCFTVASPASPTSSSLAANRSQDPLPDYPRGESGRQMRILICYCFTTGWAQGQYSVYLKANQKEGCCTWRRDRRIFIRNWKNWMLRNVYCNTMASVKELPRKAT